MFIKQIHNTPPYLSYQGIVFILVNKHTHYNNCIYRPFTLAKAFDLVTYIVSYNTHYTDGPRRTSEQRCSDHRTTFSIITYTVS